VLSGDACVQSDGGSRMSIVGPSCFASRRRHVSGYGCAGRSRDRGTESDCAPTELTKSEMFKRGSEHFERGGTLYVQGDYEGAVKALVYSYCQPARISCAARAEARRLLQRKKLQRK
jgi:hypothetical protein